MKRRSFLRNGLLGAFVSSLPLAVSATQAGGHGRDEGDDDQDVKPSERAGYTAPDDNDKEIFIEVPPGNLSIGVPEHVPDDAPVYDASEYELREAPAFSEAIEQLSPDFEPGKYILFMHYEHWRELNRHIATHSNDVSLTAYSDFESHPDEERFFDFGDFVLNTQSGGYV